MQQGFIKRQQQPPAAPSGSRLEKREAMLLKHHPSFSDELLALRNARDTFISLLPLAVMGMAVGFLVKQLLADPNVSYPLRSDLAHSRRMSAEM